MLWTKCSSLNRWNYDHGQISKSEITQCFAWPIMFTWCVSQYGHAIYTALSSVYSKHIHKHTYFLKKNWAKWPEKFIYLFHECLIITSYSQVATVYSKMSDLPIYFVRSPPAWSTLLSVRTYPGRPGYVLLELPPSSRWCIVERPLNSRFVLININYVHFIYLSI